MSRPALGSRGAAHVVRGAGGLEPEAARSQRRLEGELRADLDVARNVPLRAVEAERRVGRVGAQVNEVRVVEGVDRLAPDLKALAFAQLEVLRERQVDALE